MTESIKVFYELHSKFYTTNELLSNFVNYFQLYLTKDKGKIIDIGCGTSTYLLDLLSSNYDLYAVDTDKDQLAHLRNREKSISQKEKINYSSDQFPSKEFNGTKFVGVVLSNFLHFMKLEECKFFINELENYIESQSVIIIKVHSWKHQKRGDYSQFKHFFTKKNLNYLFSKNHYDYLYEETVSAKTTVKNIKLLKEWNRILCKKNGIFDERKIKKREEYYLKNSANTENITIVVRKK